MAGPMDPKRSDITPAAVRPMALPPRAVTDTSAVGLPPQPGGEQLGPVDAQGGDGGGRQDVADDGPRPQRPAAAR